MTARSTRQKIRDQAGKMINSCNDIVYHLKNLSDLADGRSEVVNKYTPLVVTLQTELNNFLLDFESRL